MKSVDFILAEDTRHTANLLRMLGLSKGLKSYHKFNEHKALPALIREIAVCQSVGLVSDAGTPGISDPGFLIVRECIRNGIDVECLSGPTAFLPALILSGFASDRFCFEGFLPAKKGRQKRLRELKEESRTMIFYESPHRISRTIGELKEAFGGDRHASVSREISKVFEETTRGSLAELDEKFQTGKAKGEFVIVVEGMK